jgi:hypothetical protein
MSQGSTISSTVTPLAADASLVLSNVPCLSSVYVKAVVSMNSSGVAFNSLADSEANSNMIGVCISKASSTVCSIRVLGVTDALYAGLDATKEYFLSDTVAGEITTVIPVASGYIVLKVGQPYSSTQLLVLKGTRMERA